MACRYYVKDVSLFEEFVTQKQFFLQAMRLITKAQLSCPVDDAITLAALALQILRGDYISDSATRHHLDKTKLVSDEVILACSSSLEQCAERVTSVYKTLVGVEEPSAVLRWAAFLPTSIHHTHV